MKKLLAIVASALTLGAFADASKMPVTFELPEGLEADTVQLVHDGDPILDITVSGATVNLDTNDLAAGDYWLALADGTQLTEVFTIKGTEEFIYSRTLAGLKLAGEEGTISYDESQTAVVYISDASYEKVIVESGTVTFGHDGSGYAKANFPANSTVEVKKDAVAALTRWGGAVNGESISGGGDYTINLDGITLTGDGIFKVIKPSNTVAAIVNGTIHGDGTIEFEDIATEINKQDHPLVFADDWTGTIKLPLIDTVAGNNPAHNLGRYGTDKSKVAISGIGGGWLTRGINVKSTLVLEGNMKITDWSQDTYKFAAIEGSGDFTVVKEGNYAPNSVVIEKIDASKYSGTIKADVNLTISSLETSLEAIPADKTKVVSLAEGTDTSKITVTVKLADGTAIDSDKISVEEDGIYVLGNDPVVPADLEGGSDDQKAAYVTWAADKNITDLTTKGIAEAFALNLTAEELAGKTFEQAVQDKLNTLITADMVAELAAKAAEGETSVTIEGYPNATFKFVPAEEIETTAKLFRLSVSFKAEIVED